MLPDDEIDALREEYMMLQSPGYARRLAYLRLIFDSNMQKVGLGQLDGKANDEERLKLVGKNQMLKQIFDRDVEVDREWNAHLERERERSETEDEEGGDIAPAYEAAQ